jgi:hypothetical protein
MNTIMNVCLDAAWFRGYSTPNRKNRIPSPQPFSPANEIPENDEVAPLDAYKIAVLILVATAILSLCC